MYKGFEIIEVTKENKHEFFQNIVNLEKTVLQNMIVKGKGQQFFITGEQGISDYIDSKYASVFISYKIDINSGKKYPICVTYITEGQTPFTYNDITKYFKYGEGYQKYVSLKYSNKNEYIEALRKIYIDKIKAFSYARNEVLNDLGYNIINMDEDKKNALLRSLIEKELKDDNNKFHEKSELREKINEIMSKYIKLVLKKSKEYESFYWLDFKTLSQIIKKEKHPQRGFKKKMKNYNKYDSTMELYDDFLSYQKYEIYEKSEGFKASKYFNANTENTIELDTYLTAPESREKGIARIVLFEGLKKAILSQKENTDNNEIFIASTLHRDNLSSKYVSEFFGLKDNLFLNRRCGIDREVHICRIKREEIDEYLSKLEKKLIVLYSYNPKNIVISRDERIEILQEQINYEQQEVQRLKTLSPKEKYISYIEKKLKKISVLKNDLINAKSKKDFSDDDGEYSDK